MSDSPPVNLTALIMPQAWTIFQQILFPWTSFEIAEVLLNFKKGSKPKSGLFSACRTNPATANM